MEGSREILTSGNKYEGKVGIDNPDMAVVRRTSTIQPPNQSTSGNVYDKDGTLKTIYISNLKKFPDDNNYYEPYDSRVVDHPTTFSETWIHLFKASLGTGVLAMPGAFKDAGWVIGILGTLFSGAVCTYTMHILIASEYVLCKRKRRPCMSYSETLQAAVEEGPESTRWLAKYAPHFINALLFLYQTGTCCIYVVFISSNLKNVADDYLNSELELKWFMLILLVPLILIGWVRNLKYLAPLSSLANALTIVSFGIIFWYLFRGLPPLSESPAFGKMGRLPLFFSTVLFAMEAIGTVMPLENEMKNPRKFGGTFGVLNLAMIPIIFLYLSVGFFGYLKYGESLKETLTLSLPQSEGLAQVAKGMLGISIFITHALVDYVAFDILFNEYIRPKTGDNIVIEYIVRTGLVCINVIGAISIPYLDLFISLMGAICLSTMGLGVPALIQLYTYWYDVRGKAFALFALKNVAVICVGLFAFVIGTYVSVGEIIQRIKDEK